MSGIVTQNILLELIIIMRNYILVLGLSVKNSSKLNWTNLNTFY